MNEETQYEGKPCRHGHVNERRFTVRYKVRDCCVTCHMIRQRKVREGNQHYKDYQREYHAKLRRENPGKLKEYAARAAAKAKPKQQADVTHESLIAELHNKVAQLLYTNSLRKYLQGNGEINDLARAEGYKTLDQVQAAVMLRAKMLVEPKEPQ